MAGEFRVNSCLVAFIVTELVSGSLLALKVFEQSTVQFFFLAIPQKADKRTVLVKEFHWKLFISL